MEELIELLTQIQELAGVGIEALQQAGSGEAPPEKGPDAGPEGAAPPAGPGPDDKA